MSKKMAKKLPLSVERQPSSELISSALPEFRWEELCDKEKIGASGCSYVHCVRFHRSSVFG